MGRGLLVAAVVALLAGTAVVGANAQSAHRVERSRELRIQSTPSTWPLQTAIMDPNLFPSGTEQEAAFALTRAAGATYVRLAANWASVVPGTLPSSGFDPADPTSQYYNWTALDEIVQAAENAGLTPILDIQDPPDWGTTIPRRGWLGPTPDIPSLKAFSEAIAAHYDGGHGAPAVHVFQVWNEPNLSIDLNPVSPVVYRNMVNAVAAAVHGVDPADLVIAGGLDPFKNSAQRFHTMAPLAFMRTLLCLSKGANPHRVCKARIHFDIWSHHPYTFGGPFGHARNPDDVSLGDLPKMTSLLHAAERLHQIVSAHPVKFWVTEFAWDTNPPNPHALKLSLQARGTAEALHQMWLSGITVVTFFLLQDMGLDTPYQCGLYFAGQPIEQARPKPTLTAFRFPFVAYLRNGAVSIWGRDATSSKKVVTIQLKHGARWRTVARIRANRYGIFVANLHLAATKRDWLRAQAPGSGASLAFSLTQPRYPHVGPWGN